MKTRNFPCALLMLALAAMLGSCSKENTAEGPTELQGEKATVNFMAQMAGETKATTPLPETAKVIIGFIPRADVGTPEPLTLMKMQYKKYTLGATALEPVADGPLALFKGTYDFYAVAENIANGQDVIYIGKNNESPKVEVHSGKDYVGGMVMGQAVAASTTANVTFTMDHLSTKINLTLAKDDETLDALNVTAVTITPTKMNPTTTDGSFNFEGHLVVTAGSLDIDHANVVVDDANPVAMDVVTAGSVFSYILLPSSQDGALTFKITASVTPNGGVAENRTYTLTHPISAATPLEGKKLYNMKATIGLYTVSFGGEAPNVEDWTAGNESTPIVPDEQ